MFHAEGYRVENTRVLLLADHNARHLRHWHVSGFLDPWPQNNEVIDGT